MPWPRNIWKISKFCLFSCNYWRILSYFSMQAAKFSFFRVTIFASSTLYSRWKKSLTFLHSASTKKMSSRAYFNFAGDDSSSWPIYTNLNYSGSINVVLTSISFQPRLTCSSFSTYLQFRPLWNHQRFTLDRRWTRRRGRV